MRKIALTIALAMTLCACGKHRPKASLRFQAIEQTRQGYVLNFTSNIKMEALYNANENEIIISKTVVCSLDGDHNFAVDHHIQHSASGLVEYKGYATRHYYSALIDFYKTDPLGTSFMPLSAAAVTKMLAKREIIVCMVRMTAFPLSPYYSEPFTISRQRIIDVL